MIREKGGTLYSVLHTVVGGGGGGLFEVAGGGGDAKLENTGPYGVGPTRIGWYAIPYEGIRIGPRAIGPGAPS